MKSGATIVTKSHLVFAVTMFRSLRSFCPEFDFFIIVTDGNASSVPETIDGFAVLSAEALAEIEPFGLIKERYQDFQQDAYRWSLKPVALEYLLNKGYCQAFFFDCDLFFFNDPHKAFATLDEKAMILSPHWRAIDPYKDPVNFQILRTSGHYNAGFIGASEKGLPALRWWAKVCAHTCTKDSAKGLYDDQAYLDILPVYFEGISSLKNKGLNVANWNQQICAREKSKNGEILINGIDPIVFIHFTGSTIRGIMNGEDGLLIPFLEFWRSALIRCANFLDLPIPTIATCYTVDPIISGSLKSKIKRSVSRIRLRR